MKVKEQGEGRRATAGGDPHVPLQPAPGHCQRVPGHCQRASAGVCWLGQASRCPTAATSPASAAGGCKGISEVFGSRPLLDGDSAQGCPQRAVRMDARPCSKPVPADSRVRGTQRDPCLPVPLLPYGSQSRRPTLCQAFPSTRLAQSIVLSFLRASPRGMVMGIAPTLLCRWGN